MFLRCGVCFDRENGLRVLWTDRNVYSAGDSAEAQEFLYYQQQSRVRHDPQTTVICRHKKHTKANGYDNTSWRDVQKKPGGH